LAATGAALSGIRAIKSERRLSMRAELDNVTVRGPAELLERIAVDDLVAAGRVATLIRVHDATATEISVIA
jgi:valyl-tRNA synthetase